MTTSHDDIHAVVVISVALSDDSKILGIKAPIMPEQYDILRNAIGKDWSTSELNKAMIITRYYDPKDAEEESDKDLNDIRDFIFDEKQIITLDETNWPREPVRVFSFLLI